MENLENLEKIKNLDSNHIIKIFNLIGKNGDIAIFKVDGIRDSDKYTVVITSGNNLFDPIRYDSSSLNESVHKALGEYMNYKTQ